MRIACVGVTNPLAGVIVAHPPIAPEQNPSTLGLPRVMYSARAHAEDPMAAARVVVTNAFAATPSAAAALPALKPYHPTHNIPVPTMQSTRLCGAMISRP